MKEATLEQFAQDVQGYLNASQQERIVITRDGKPWAVLTGVAHKDQEDLRLEASPAFWRMIEEARERPTVRLRDVEKELFADEVQPTS